MVDAPAKLRGLAIRVTDRDFGFALAEVRRPVVLRADVLRPVALPAAVFRAVVFPAAVFRAVVFPAAVLPVAALRAAGLLAAALRVVGLAAVVRRTAVLEAAVPREAGFPVTARRAPVRRAGEDTAVEARLRLAGAAFGALAVFIAFPALAVFVAFVAGAGFAFELAARFAVPVGRAARFRPATLAAAPALVALVRRAVEVVFPPATPDFVVFLRAILMKPLQTLLIISQAGKYSKFHAMSHAQPEAVPTTRPS